MTIEATPNKVDWDYWIERTRKHVREGRGTAYGTLVMDMIWGAGWNVAQQMGAAVGIIAERSTTDEDGATVIDGAHLHGFSADLAQAAVQIHYELGWPQATLFAAWFRRKSNRDMIYEIRWDR